MSTVTLRSGALRLEIDPECGGGVTRFALDGLDLFRRAMPGTALDLSSFALVPFSNRIAHGRYAWNGAHYAVAPNMPGVAHPHPLHGFGWLAAWQVAEATPDRAVLRHHHDTPDWPSAYVAEQRLSLTASGLRHELAITNVGEEAMPAGLGLHPYFPRNGATIDASFDGVWETSDEGLPIRWTPLAAVPDWFGGTTIDTLFTGGQGAITIDWPTHRVTIAPHRDLGQTLVYVPGGKDFFCIEPVSHRTDAINASPTGMRRLDPGEIWRTHVTFEIEDRR